MDVSKVVASFFFFFLKEKSSPVGGRGVQTSRSKVCRELSFVITGRRIAFYEPNPTGRRRDMDDLKQSRSQFEVGVCKGFGLLFLFQKYPSTFNLRRVERTSCTHQKGKGCKSLNHCSSSLVWMLK